MTAPVRHRREASARRRSIWLIVVGTLVALVAGTLLVLQLRGGGDVEVPSTTAAGPLTTATASPSTDAETTSAKPTAKKKVRKKAARKTAEPTGSGSTRTGSGEPAAGAGSGAPTASATSLSIPSAGISQGIQPQGLAADGTINPASGQVIWFTGNGRVEPGRPGTSVIAGHVTWGGRADAFYSLGQVGLGDTISIGYADGSTRSFTVTEVRPVGKEALARSLTVWGPHPQEPTLVLVTCDAAQGYLDDGHTVANLLVVAKPS